MNSTVKALIMVVVTFLASIVYTQGLPTESTGWIALGITVVGTALLYIGKNFVFPSVSIFGNINLADLLSGLILAIGGGLFTWVGTFVTGQPVNWNNLWQMMLTIIVGYLAKTFAQPTSLP